MAQSIDFDVDIDLADRTQALNVLPHVVASIDGTKKHNTGVYFQKAPLNPLAGVCALDYKSAADAGYFKVDFLNNHVYADVRDEAHLDQLLQAEPMWELLTYPEVVENLFHVSNYGDLLRQHQPQSVEQLAMFLAMIRPAKKHLLGKTWDEIREDVWTPPQDGSYYFKHSHAISYAMVIVVQLNLLAENASQLS
jgi:hypothetical protein